jgi:hypothetical protein
MSPVQFSPDISEWRRGIQVGGLGVPDACHTGEAQIVRPLSALFDQLTKRPHLPDGSACGTLTHAEYRDRGAGRTTPEGPL